MAYAPSQISALPSPPESPTTTVFNTHIHNHPANERSKTFTHTLSMTSTKTTKAWLSQNKIVKTTTRSMSLSTKDLTSTYSNVKTTTAPVTVDSLEYLLKRNADNLVPAWDRVREAEKALEDHQAEILPRDASLDMVRKWSEEQTRLSKRLDGLRHFRDCLGTQRATLLKKQEKLLGPGQRRDSTGKIQNHAAGPSNTALQYHAGGMHHSRVDDNPPRHAAGSVAAAGPYPTGGVELSRWKDNLRHDAGSAITAIRHPTGRMHEPRFEDSTRHSVATGPPTERYCPGGPQFSRQGANARHAAAPSSTAEGYPAGGAHFSRMEDNTRHALMIAEPRKPRSERAQRNVPAPRGFVPPLDYRQESSRGHPHRPRGDFRAGPGTGRGAPSGLGNRWMGESFGGDGTTDSEWEGSQSSGGVGLG